MCSLRIGIIGAGWVARNRHIPAFRRDARATIVAIADHSAERARAVATEAGIPYHTADPNDLFGRVDVLSICTPPWTHAELSIQALRNGCHVLVEKPMATSSEESSAMADASAASDRLLGVSHNFLFSRSARRALDLLAQGAIGHPQALVGYQLSSWRRRIPDWYRRLPGGLFFDEAPHMLYLTRAFLGELTVVSAQLGDDAGNGLSRIHTSLHGERGEAQLEMFAGAPLSEWILAVVGSEGILAIDLFRDITLRLRTDGHHRPLDVLHTSLQAATQHLAGVFTSGALLLRGTLSYGHDLLVRRFIDAVLGRGPLPVTAQDGVAIVRTLESIVTLGQTNGSRRH